MYNLTTGNTCLRNLVCQHCANQALELDKPPTARFAKSNGVARCLICRETRANAALLNPGAAYLPNFNLMEVMDLLGLGGSCRKCNLEFESQVRVV